MLTLATYLLSGVATLLAIPTVVFFLEVLAGCFLPKRDRFQDNHRTKRTAVLIPAHNESSGLQPTLDDVSRQLRNSDRLVVVADNCTDDTAAVAASCGAEISVRNDLTRIGKGYALDWGLSFLATDPPEIVVVVDADCRLGDGVIDRLATVSARLQRPVQALYLMTASEGSTISHQVAEFAWRLKNLVRPLGLSALSLPCQLMGTGMAFPWATIRSADLSNGFIVEDLKLGLELAAAGSPPVFCPSAIVTSTFPNSSDGAKRQRQRWEQGQISLILTSAPALVLSAIKRRDSATLALALDLIVPPLSLFGTIWMAITICALAAALLGGSRFALLVSAACMALVFSAIVLAWLKFGRDLLPLRSFGSIGSYYMAKLRTYGAALSKRGRISGWTRADRN
jgi:cellulose synthase/poly-beta-1,6-N-acetylglucosamine synthase-like glycosyltransferase